MSESASGEGERERGGGEIQTMKKREVEREKGTESYTDLFSFLFTSSDI